MHSNTSDRKTTLFRALYRTVATSCCGTVTGNIRRNHPALLIAALLLTLQASAQQFYPRSQAEDRDHAMSDAYWQLWNPQVQEEIDRRIDTNRKADAILDFSGLDVDGEVSIRQTGHSFIFGAHIFNYDQLGTTERNERYKELYGTLFNSATIAFYWRTFETEHGRLRFAEEYWDTEEWWNAQSAPAYQTHWRRPSTDKIVQFCESKGIRAHGHVLIWGNRKWQHPTWLYQTAFNDTTEQRIFNSMLKTQGNLANYRNEDTYTDLYNSSSAQQIAGMLPKYTQALNQAYEERIRLIAEHYGGRLASWDVVNESAVDYGRGLLPPDADLAKSVYGIMPGDYPYKALKWADRYFPKSVKLNINDYEMGPTYRDQVKELVERGCRIDIMGAQMHLFDPQQCLDIAAGKELQTPAQIKEWIERLGENGIPIHLSEITITSPSLDTKGQQIQAVIARNLYRLWFSYPQLMGITWWNVVDGCGAPGEPAVSGLFSRDMQPKTSYYALDDLINREWKTSLDATPDRKHQISFRGFKGEYTVTWKDPSGFTHSKTITLDGPATFSMK